MQASSSWSLHPPLLTVLLLPGEGHLRCEYCVLRTVRTVCWLALLLVSTYCVFTCVHVTCLHVLCVAYCTHCVLNCTATCVHVLCVTCVHVPVYRERTTCAVSHDKAAQLCTLCPRTVCWFALLLVSTYCVLLVFTYCALVCTVTCVHVLCVGFTCVHVLCVGFT